MNRQSRKVTSKYGKFINKRNYQYLGLLGISLFSLSLSQLKPVDAYADSTGEQKVSSLKIIKMENMYELLMLISIRLNSYLIDRRACEHG